jgi:Spy/CpxP family protein refolding chaperone
MKKITKITLILLTICIKTMAQKQVVEGNQKIEAARIGMITNRLNLSTDQATAFWPIFNEYEGSKMEIKKGLRKHLSESRSLANTDEKILAELKEMMALRQKEIDLDKDYMGKFLKVINPRQVSELYRTDQMFKQMLLKRMGNRENLENKGPKGRKERK